MKREEISIRFDLDNARDRRIFTGMKKLPKYIGEPDHSEAFIKFMDNLIGSLSECEQKREECESMLNHFLGKEVEH